MFNCVVCSGILKLYENEQSVDARSLSTQYQMDTIWQHFGDESGERGKEQATLPYGADSLG